MDSLDEPAKQGGLFGVERQPGAERQPAAVPHPVDEPPQPVAQLERFVAVALDQQERLGLLWDQQVVADFGFPGQAQMPAIDEVASARPAG